MEMAKVRQSLFLQILEIKNFQTTKFFWIDDVYVTGFLRAKLNITLVDMSQYQMLDSKQLLARKALLNPKFFDEDYINTLVESGKDSLRVRHFNISAVF